MQNKSFFYKIIMILLVTSLLFTVLIIVLYNLKHKQEQFLNNELNLQFENEVNSIIGLKSSSIKQVVYDYTFWTEFTEKVQSNDAYWFENNITTILKSFHLNYVSVYDTSFNLKHEAKDSTFNLQNFITKKTLNNLKEKKFLNYFMLSDSGLIQISSATIHPDSDPEHTKTKPEGFMIVAKKWDNSFLDELSLLCNSTIKLLKDTNRTFDKQQYTISTLIKLYNDENKNFANLEFSRENKLSLHFNKLSLVMKLIMGILLITVLLIIGFTLKKWVSTPLKLVEEILKNENDEQIEKLIQYKGEFELIGNLFKQFLNQKKELEVAIEKAEQSNRLKAAFLNNISHEIRTPLNGILGFASLISDSQTTTEEKLRYQEIMYHSSERLIKTITDYIDVSLLFSSNFEVNYFRFRLYDVVEDILLKYKPLCENKNLRFVINIDEESKILQITSDKRVIFKILDQLMDNAIKFTFEGFVEIEIVKSSDFVYFIVKDSGIGITDELHAKIFDFFTQADNSDTRRFEGSGLGLYISSELAKLLNCKLNIESKPGSGSKFSFSLSV